MNRAATYAQTLMQAGMLTPNGYPPPQITPPLASRMRDLQDNSAGNTNMFLRTQPQIIGPSGTAPVHPLFSAFMQQEAAAAARPVPPQHSYATSLIPALPQATAAVGATVPATVPAGPVQPARQPGTITLDSDTLIWGALILGVFLLVRSTRAPM